ncbi:hypothetical protein [Desulforamulus aquiferis]|uniref:Uncharacterized protein n=1 Tax=Desulforamulus aquiferis TaxID=1397668 RepID=A0AAW7Z9A6_9FIRM|nr:hypothetical protein [Desulforamulus aquiferis]MDO7785676.1 hypothetical protein [Desulforamulus aquiferis]
MPIVKESITSRIKLRTTLKLVSTVTPSLLTVPIYLLLISGLFYFYST